MPYAASSDSTLQRHEKIAPFSHISIMFHNLRAFLCLSKLRLMSHQVRLMNALFINSRNNERNLREIFLSVHEDSIIDFFPLRFAFFRFDNEILLLFRRAATSAKT